MQEGIVPARPGAVRTSHGGDVHRARGGDLSAWLNQYRGGPLGLIDDIATCGTSEEVGRHFLDLCDHAGLACAVLGLADSTSVLLDAEVDGVGTVYFALGTERPGEDAAQMVGRLLARSDMDRIWLPGGGFLIANGLGALAAMESLALRAILGEMLARLRHLVQTRLLAPLSPRQRECVKWTALGKTSGETAGILELKENTINNYIAAAINKLGAVNKTHLVFLCLSGQAPAAPVN